MKEKQERVRAIVFHGDKIASMYREREERIFYTFPGGGMEANETEEECVTRELFEEFGLKVKPLKKVYTYEGHRGVEHFYICEWGSGELGTGTGEEFQPERKNGTYIPMLIDIAQIPSLPLMPPEIAKAFVEDYTQNGQALREDVKVVKESL